MTLIFIGLQNAIYYPRYNAPRTNRGSRQKWQQSCVLFLYTNYCNTIKLGQLLQRCTLRLLQCTYAYIGHAGQQRNNNINNNNDYNRLTPIIRLLLTQTAAEKFNLLFLFVSHLRRAILHMLFLLHILLLFV